MARLLTRGLRRRCPRCGGGRLFTGWINLKERCPTCGWRFERRAEEGFFLGALALNIGITEGLLAVMIGVSFAVTLPDPPIGLLCLIAVPLMVAVPILFYPVSKTLWSAVDLLLRPPGPEDEAQEATRSPSDASRDASSSSQNRKNPS